MAFIDDFKARFPEFDTATVDTLLPAVEPYLPCYYGGVYGQSVCDDEILLQLAAHLMVFEQRSSAGRTGTIRSASSRSVGNVSISYGDVTNPSASRRFFHTTIYGQRYLQLTSKNAPGGVFV